MFHTESDGAHKENIKTASGRSSGHAPATPPARRGRESRTSHSFVMVAFSARAPDPRFIEKIDANAKTGRGYA
jgi:hypothetical protein